METKTVVTLILSLYLLMAVLGGLKQGILGKGRWVLGLVFAILAAPLVSPVIERLLIHTKIAKMILTDIPQIRPVTTVILRLLIFSLSLVIIKKSVYYLTELELPKGLKILDSIAGAVFTVLEAMLLIWLFEIFMQLSGNAPLFSGLHRTLMQSGLYTFIAEHNLLSAFFR